MTTRSAWHLATATRTHICGRCRCTIAPGQRLAARLGPPEHGTNTSTILAVRCLTRCFDEHGMRRRP